MITPRFTGSQWASLRRLSLTDPTRLIFIQISGVDTLLGTNATDRLSKSIELPLGSNPKLVFVPSVKMLPNYLLDIIINPKSLIKI